MPRRAPSRPSSLTRHDLKVEMDLVFQANVESLEKAGTCEHHERASKTRPGQRRNAGVGSRERERSTSRRRSHRTMHNGGRVKQN
jgi:hypothetical protein